MQRIEGIFSGTLSYIFNSFGQGRSFSSVVAEAKEAGFTEPDPRDDLSGGWLASAFVQPLDNRLHPGSPYLCEVHTVGYLLGEQNTGRAEISSACTSTNEKRSH